MLHLKDLNTKFAEHVNLCLDQRGIHHEFNSKLEAFANATNKTLVELTANFITLSKELEETQKQNGYLWNLNSELQTKLQENPQTPDPAPCSCPPFPFEEWEQMKRDIAITQAQSRNCQPFPYQEWNQLKNNVISLKTNLTEKDNRICYL